MYIPIGPSKKQLYKIILLLLCLLFGFKSCTKALVVSNTFDMNNSCYNLTNSCSISYGSSTFNGVGKGTIYFDVIGVGAGARPLQDVNVELSNGKTTSCMIGNLQMYSDSNNQYAIQQVECPVEIPSNVYLSKIWLATNYNSVVTLNHSYRMTFYDSDSAAVVNAINSQNYTSLLTNIQNDLYNFKLRTNEQLVDLYTLIENNQSNISNITNNVSNINDNINNDNVDNNQANSFFNDFNSNTPEGLVSLINKPLDFLNGLYNECSPIMVHVPYFDFDLTLPCISTIHNGIFDIIIPIAKIIINGLICYRLVLGFINIINKLKDPNESDIEVVDL